MEWNGIHVLQIFVGIGSFFMDDILTCQSKTSTGVTNKDGSILFIVPAASRHPQYKSSPKWQAPIANVTNASFDKSKCLL